MGPELGSLNEMLCGGEDPPIVQPRKVMGKAPAMGPSIPRPSSGNGPRKPPADGTLLNKKVAFRMLKQLGCPIHQGDDTSEASSASESYIEVHVDDQPVLFNMLKELGYRPCRSAYGVPIIRVVDEQRRTQQEAMAALASRSDRGRSTSEVPSEQGSEGKRIPVKDLKESLDRLSKPRPPKPPPETASTTEAAPPKVRTAQEQKDAIERLAGKKFTRSYWKDSEVSVPDGEGLGSQTLKRSPSGDIQGTDTAGSTYPLCRKSPRLSRAAISMLGNDCSMERPRSLDAKGPNLTASTKSSSSSVKASPPTPQARPSTPTDSQEMAHESDAQQFVDRQPEQRSEPGSSTTGSFIGRRDQRHRPQSDTVKWLESMGFANDMSKEIAPKKVSKVQQQEALNRLAQPRKKPTREEQEEAATVEAPKRSAKEQAEFLAKLAQPKQKKVQQDHDEESRETDTAPKEPGAPYPQSKEPGAPYAQSSKLANPYVANPYISVAQTYGKTKSSIAGSGCEEDGKDNVEPGRLPFTPLVDTSGAGSQRLERIDETPSPEPGQQAAGLRSRSLSSGPRPRLLRRPRSRDDLETQQIHVHHHVHVSDGAQPSRPPRIPGAPGSNKSVEKNEDEALLRKIDKLYSELVQTPQTEPGEEVKEQSSRSIPQEQQEAIHKVLEEVLWSAVMLKRSAAEDVDVQDALLWLMPKEDLRKSAAISNVVHGLPKTLLQGLERELPDICRLVSFSGKPPQVGADQAITLVEKIRRARDGLLALAFSAGAEPGSVIEPETAKGDTQPLADEGTQSSWQSSAAPMSQRSQLTQDSSGAPRRKARKPRKTSLSHWTEESLTTLKPPPENWFEEKECEEPSA